MLETRTCTYADESTLTTGPSGTRVLPLLESDAGVLMTEAASTESRLGVEQELDTAADLGRCRDAFAIFAFAASAIIIFSMSSPFVPFLGVRWEPRPVHTDTADACVVGVPVGSSNEAERTGSSVADRRDDCGTTKRAATMSRWMHSH